MTWGFIWLMFVLKIPILMLLGIVWWAIRQDHDPAADVPPESVPARPHPPGRTPRKRPRGPHGEPAMLPSPPRVRTTVAKGRDTSRDA